MLTVGRALSGMDLTEINRIKSTPFIVRLLICTGLIGLSIWLSLEFGGILGLLGMVILGLMYAHAVELQHQALHNTGFPNKTLSRVVGFLLGLPMLVSYSDYQYHHFQHHRLLGTRENREFFNYGYNRLTSLKPLTAHLFMLGHYREVAKFITWSLMGRLRTGVKRDSAVRIRTEYCLMAVFLVTMVVISVSLETTVFLKIWILPLLIAIPAHTLIELPEHWGKEADTVDVSINTRTIKATWFGYWFTNGNNYHIEHHWLPSVPNDRLPELHRLISAETETESYPQFYKRFFIELCHNRITRPPKANQAASA
jgi:fatty acid desaturase